MKAQTFEQLLSHVEQIFRGLPDKPEETPDSVSRALWLSAAGQATSTERAVRTDLPALSADQIDRLQALLARLQDGEPVAHITGRQSFCGLELQASPAALIPRKETELLARTAESLLRDMADAEPRVLDLCCGCGNLALYLASQFPQASVHGSDLAAEAVALAEENARFTELNDRVSFVCSDMYEAFRTDEFLGKTDLITCNPPYISSAKVEKMPEEISGHEPKLAFDGGAFGISIIQKLIQEAPEFLVPGGWLVFELGLGQGAPILKRQARNQAFTHLEGITDEQGDIRVIRMQRAA